MLGIISRPENKRSHAPCCSRLTCSLVGLDFVQSCESPQRPAFFEGHNRYHVLLVVQTQLGGFSHRRQLDCIFYSAVVHRMRVFLWLRFIWQGWQGPHWCRFLLKKKVLTQLVKDKLFAFLWSWLVTSGCWSCVIWALGRCTFFQIRRVNLTVSGESVLLVLRMISSSRWRKENSFVKTFSSFNKTGLLMLLVWWTQLHSSNFFSIKHFQPFSSLAALPPLSVRLFPAPVWSVRPSPSLWLVHPLSVSDRKQDNKKRMKTVIFHEKQISKRKCVHKDSLHFPPVSAGGRPPSWPELFLPRPVSAPLPPSSSSPRWDVEPQPAGALAPLPSCAPALRDTAWTRHKLQYNIVMTCHCSVSVSWRGMLVTFLPPLFAAAPAPLSPVGAGPLSSFQPGDVTPPPGL